ncbi:MAG: hypothetical protein QOI36_2038, partial [Pseudonocardiales bacterium]|nr:hypothetical protein [Pseudonocardiales bacterium]
MASFKHAYVGLCFNQSRAAASEMT